MSAGIAADRSDMALRKLERAVAARNDYIAILEYENEQLREYKDGNERYQEPIPDAVIHVVFDGPPSHPGPCFVEVENDDGASIKVGEWYERPDGYWALRIQRRPLTLLERLEAWWKRVGP